MAYQNEKNKQETKQDSKSLKERNQSREPNYTAIPNSDMLAMPIPPLPPGTPNSVMREFLDPQISAAEDEANRLSAGVTSGSPNSVRREMADRLGSDFSSVHFHSDPGSVRRSEAMGARAFTQGNDIYFGKGGFEPRIAAHELVHTVQQGAAQGTVSRSVAPGTVQMWSWLPWKWKIWKKISNLFKKPKESEYDQDKSSSDIADNLFRIQAGIEASNEDEKLQRDTESAITYISEQNKNKNQIVNDKELIFNDDKSIFNDDKSKLIDDESKLIEKNEDQGLIQIENDDEPLNKIPESDNIGTVKLDYVSPDDKISYNTNIQNMTKDTFIELVKRRNQAAEELCNYFSSLNAHDTETRSVDKNCYRAATNGYGRNYKLYTQLIRKVKKSHRNKIKSLEDIESQNTPEKMKEFLTLADNIFELSTSKKNEYLKTNDEIQDRIRNDKASLEEYKNIYNKKKTKLDRMAAVYKSRRELNGPGNVNGLRDNNDELINSGGEANGLKLADLPRDSEMVQERLEEKKNFSEEKWDKIDIIDSEENAIIRTDSWNEKKNEDSNVRAAILDYINKQKAEEEDNPGEEQTNLINEKPGQVTEALVDDVKADPNQNAGEVNKQGVGQNDLIQHKPGQVTEALIDDYMETYPIVSNAKKHNSNFGVIRNISSMGENSDQIAWAIKNNVALQAGEKSSSYLFHGMGIAGNTLGLASGLLGTVTAATDLTRNYNNMNSGGSFADVATSGLDLANSAGTTISSTFGLMKNLGSIPTEFTQTLGNIGKSAPVSTAMPGINIATGLLMMGSGATNAIRGGVGLGTINKQIKDLDKEEYKNAENQEQLRKIFNQGQRIAKLRRDNGIWKGVNGAVNLATGIALLSGPLAPIVAPILGIASAGLALGGYIFGRVQKKNIYKDVTAEEMGFKSWKEEIKKVKEQFPDEDLDDDEAKEIILKSHGYDTNTRTAAFKMINEKRAKFLLDIANNSKDPLQPLVEKVIGALGVSQRKDGRYAPGAQKLLAEKLGGA